MQRIQIFPLVNVIRLCLIIGLFQTHFIHSQESNVNAYNYQAEVDQRAPIPVTPESQAFMKYGDTPVNLYYGTPNISVPIYVHQGREMSLPITLTYDASGIKVDQLPSLVGLGWNLNAGGRITRMVNGYPDDYESASAGYESWYSSAVRNKMSNYITDYPRFTAEGTTGMGDFATVQEAGAYLEFLDKVHTNQWEIQPDYYSVNAPGVSDHFVLDLDRQPVALTNPRTKITKSGYLNSATDSVNTWTVYNDSGTKYTFTAQEETKVNGNDNDPEAPYGVIRQYISSWYLTQIESPNGKDIYEFSYATHPNRNPVNSASYTQARTNLDYLGQNQNPQTDLIYSGGAGTEYFGRAALSQITYNGKLMLSVTNMPYFNQGPDTAVTQFDIYKPVEGSSATELMKRVKLNYSYFKTSSGIDHTVTGNQLKVRLKLDGVDVHTGDNGMEKVESYGFSYDSPNAIPSLATVSQDYMGYYNGASSSQQLFPANSAYGLSGGNRSPNFSLTKRGILTRIDYPTGGHSLFNYEQNSEHIPEYSNPDIVKANLTMTVDNLPPVDPELCNASTQNGEITPQFATATFNNSIYEGRHRITHTSSGGSPLLHSFPSDVQAFVFQLPQGGSPYTYEELFDSNCNLKPGINMVYRYDSQLDNEKRTVYLDIATHQLVLISPVNNKTLGLQVEGPSNTSTVTYGEEPKAGLRIARIKDYTDSGTLAGEKKYEYVQGTIINQMLMEYETQEITFNNSENENELSTFLNRLSHPGNTGKPEIGYGQVTVNGLDASGNGSNGSTKYTFKTAHYGNYRTGSYSYRVGNRPPSGNHFSSYHDLGQQTQKRVSSTTGQTIRSESTEHTDRWNYYKNTGLYLDNEGKNNYLYPYITSNGSGGYRIALKQGTPGPSGLNGVSLARPSECSGAYMNGYSQYCQPKYARLILTKTHAWGYTGGVRSTVVSEVRGPESVSTKKDLTYHFEIQTEDSPDPPPCDGDCGPEDLPIIEGSGSIANSSGYLPAQEELIGSVGDSQTTHYYYPDNFLGYLGLKNRNMLTTPVMVLKKNNEDTLVATLTEYSGKQPSIIKTSRNSDPFEERAIFERYESGNLVQVRQKDGPPTAYVWGYDDRYVVAKIENATYDQIEDLPAFGENFNLAFNGLSTAQETALRTMPNTLVTTFGYDPLVGVTSITDPRGYTTYYEYDDLNRLRAIRDADDNLIQEHDYHYRTGQ